MAIPTPSIQRGSVTSGSSSTTVAITSVDTTKSILMVSCSNDNNSQDQRVFPTIRFTSLSGDNSAELTLTRDAAGSGNETWNWEVYTFDSGVSVQHFSAVRPASVTTSVTLTAVDLTKTFPILHSEWDSNASPQNEHIRAEITSTTNCDMICGTTSAGNKRYTLQIVEMDDPAVTVEKINHTWTTESTATPTITSVDTTKAFAVNCGFSSTDATVGHAGSYYTCAITGATTLTLRKSDGTLGAGTSTIYIVEIDQADVLVQSEDDITPSSGSATSTFGTPITLSQTMVIPGNYMFSMRYTSSTSAQANAYRSSISTTTYTLTSGGSASDGGLVSQVITIGDNNGDGGDGGVTDPIIDGLYDSRVIPKIYS